MKKLNFDGNYAEKRISQVQDKLWYFWKLHEHERKQFFIYDTVTLNSWKIQEVIIEFRSSIYTLWGVIFIPVWVPVFSSRDILFSVEHSVLTANYQFCKTIDITQLNFLKVPYSHRDTTPWYTHNAVKHDYFWLDIERIVMVLDESIWGVEKVMRFHKK